MRNVLPPKSCMSQACQLGCHVLEAAETHVPQRKAALGHHEFLYELTCLQNSSTNKYLPSKRNREETTVEQKIPVPRTNLRKLSDASPTCPDLQNSHHPIRGTKGRTVGLHFGGRGILKPLRNSLSGSLLFVRG